MSVKVDEQGQLRRLEADLQSRYHDLPPELVSEQVRAGLAEFADARIRSYVPVLLGRRAAERLRTLAGPPDAAE
jgi:hypothetical protein